MNLEYYDQRARGGCGLILTEGTLISQQGTEWPYAPGIWSEDHVVAWRKVTDAVHAAGSLIFCQVSARRHRTSGEANGLVRLALARRSCGASRHA